MIPPDQIGALEALLRRRRQTPLEELIPENDPIWELIFSDTPGMEPQLAAVRTTHVGGSLSGSDGTDPEFEVLRPIVVPDPVDVVHTLAPLERTTELPLHDQPVFGDHRPVHADPNVAVLGHPTIRLAPSTLERVRSADLAPMDATVTTEVGRTNRGSSKVARLLASFGHTCLHIPIVTVSEPRNAPIESEVSHATSR